MRPENVACVRCGCRPGVDGFGCCGVCAWAIQAEVTEGLKQITAYLETHARFSAWCESHGVAA